MEDTKGWKKRIRDKLPILVLAFCIVQPILDVAGYWQNRAEIGNTVTMLLRMVLLGGCVLLGFLLSDRKRYYYIAAAVLLLLTGGHILACRQSANGYRKPVTDLINLVRIYFLPMVTLCFITFLRQNENVFSAIKKGLLADLLLIAAVQLVSGLFDPNPTTYTYAVDKTGILGWFMWTNSQSAILGMLAPICICWAVYRKNRWVPLVAITVICEAALYVLAPRLSYASLIGAGVGIAASLLIWDRKRIWQALVVLGITILFLAAYPISFTAKRLGDNEIRLSDTKKHIAEMDIEPVTMVIPTDVDGETIEDAEPEIILDEEQADKYEKLYRSQDIIWSMVDRFGRDRVLKAYDYTLDPSILSSTRLMKLKFCSLLMEESGTLSHLFGLNLNEMTHQRYDKDSKLVTDNYDVENDFHGVYYLTGWVGLCLMILFLLYFGIRALAAIVRHPKQKLNVVMASFLLAYGIGIIHAYFTASVLRRNNASVYLALVLAVLWFLADRKQPASLPENDGTEK